jgi:hypothetical protein
MENTDNSIAAAAEEASLLGDIELAEVSTSIRTISDTLTVPVESRDG